MTSSKRNYEADTILPTRLTSGGTCSERKTEATCRRCGKCCHYYKDGRLKKCKFLIVMTNGHTFCRIYPNRLGVEIDTGIFCNKREDVPYDYSGCPYNTNKKVLF